MTTYPKKFVRSILVTSLLVAATGVWVWAGMRLPFRFRTEPQFGAVAIAQTLSLWGDLYYVNPVQRQVRRSLPGYKVYLYSAQTSRWIGPSTTDLNGRYVFYDLQPGRYLLRVYSSNFRLITQGNPPPYLWQQEVSVQPGRVLSQQIQTIVLTTLTPR